MTFPEFLLCSRCSSAIERVTMTNEARRWFQLVTPRGTVDICPDCAKGVVAFLKTTPDPLEDAAWQ